MSLLILTKNTYFVTVTKTMDRETFACCFPAAWPSRSHLLRSVCSTNTLREVTLLHVRRVFQHFIALHFLALHNMPMPIGSSRDENRFALTTNPMYSDILIQSHWDWNSKHATDSEYCVCLFRFNYNWENMRIRMI